MSAAVIAPLPPDSPARGGFWHRRCVQPILAQLKQGVAPDQIARTLAVGTACSLFPFLGFTALLNFIVGLVLRMNQPILQTLNQLLAPLQIALILVYVRGGELIWRTEGAHFTIGEMVREFRDRTFLEFLQRFGWAGVHAFTAWAISAPVIVAVLYWLIRPAVRRAAARSA